MQYEQDSLYSSTSDRQTQYVAGMPWPSRDQTVVSDQQVIMGSDDIVAVDVIYPHNAAGAVAVSARRLSLAEATSFAQEVPGTLLYLEVQVMNGGGLRNFGSGGVRRTWESDLRHATALGQHLLSRIESRLRSEGGSRADLVLVKFAQNAVRQVASRACWQKKSQVR